MDETNETNEVSGDVQETAAQPVAGQGTVGGDQAPETVGGEGILVGNQRFATQEELIKSYQELQKGHTQTNQRHAEELRAYEPYRKIFNDLKKNPDEFRRFQEYLKAGGKIPAPQKQENAQPGQPDPFKDQIMRRVEEAEAKLEWNEFRAAHPELSDEDRREVVKLLTSEYERGIDLSLEHAYKLFMFDKNAGKLVSNGQKKAEDALTKGKQASSLNSAPAGSSGVKNQKRPNLNEIKNPQDQKKWMYDRAKELGIKWEEDE